MEEFKRITLILTNACMLSCEYCEGYKDNSKMSVVILTKALKLLSNFDKQKYISLLFFGGEPLIRFQLIKKAISILKRIDEINRYSFCIFTNGILLNRIDLDFLANNNIGLRISIDGDLETTSLHRKSAVPGINVYYNIKNVLPKLKSLKIDFSAAMTVSPYTVDKLFDNFRHLLKLGFSSIEFVPVLRTDNHFFWDENALKILKKQVKKISEMYLKIILKSKDYSQISSFSNYRIYKKQIKSGLGFVELADRKITVDVDGGIYIGDSFLLFNPIQRKKIKIGNVQNIKSLEKLYKEYVDDKQAFLAYILNNPFVAECRRHPAVKILNEAMRQFDKKLAKIQPLKRI